MSIIGRWGEVSLAGKPHLWAIIFSCLVFISSLIRLVNWLIDDSMKEHGLSADSFYLDSPIITYDMVQLLYREERGG